MKTTRRNGRFLQGSMPSAGGPRTSEGLDLVFLGLSITSSWGNGHATTYRALIRALSRRGHRVTFLERNVPWYAENRDLPDPPYCTLRLYDDPAELQRYREELRDADAVVVGSFVPDGVAVARWALEASTGVVGFYDIDTPVTLARLVREEHDYLTPDLIPLFDLYLSFTGGPTLERLEREFGARSARPLYCSVDEAHYHAEAAPARYDLGYMGTFSEDRQPSLEARLLEAARAWPEGRFVVAGPGYPDHIAWPSNVERIEHLPPARHRSFYCGQRYTLNVTREDMRRVGYAPSVRLFEAAACGTPIISDYWEGLETFFEPDREILVSDDHRDTLRYLRDLSDEDRLEIGRRARERVLSAHTAVHRAQELEVLLLEALARASNSYTR